MHAVCNRWRPECAQGARDDVASLQFGKWACLDHYWNAVSWPQVLLVNWGSSSFGGVSRGSPYSCTVKAPLTGEVFHHFVISCSEGLSLDFHACSRWKSSLAQGEGDLCWAPLGVVSRHWRARMKESDEDWIPYTPSRCARDLGALLVSTNHEFTRLCCKVPRMNSCS
jgi:hypothetical protein